MIDPEFKAVVPCIADDILNVKDLLLERGLSVSQHAKICAAIDVLSFLEDKAVDTERADIWPNVTRKGTADVELSGDFPYSPIRFFNLGPACVRVDFLDWVSAIGVSEADAARKLQAQLARDYPTVYLEFRGFFERS